MKLAFICFLLFLLFLCLTRSTCGSDQLQHNLFSVEKCLSTRPASRSQNINHQCERREDNKWKLLRRMVPSMKFMLSHEIAQNLHASRSAWRKRQRRKKRCNYMSLAGTTKLFNFEALFFTREEIFVLSSPSREGTKNTKSSEIIINEEASPRESKKKV